eukprot:gene1550-32932_t
MEPGRSSPTPLAVFVLTHNGRGNPGPGLCTIRNSVCRYSTVLAERAEAKRQTGITQFSRDEQFISEGAAGYSLRFRPVGDKNTDIRTASSYQEQTGAEVDEALLTGTRMDSSIFPKQDLLPDLNNDMSEVNSSLFVHVFRWLKKRGKHLPAKLTDQQGADFKECFNLMDEDGSGAIDAQELQSAFKLLGINMTRREVDLIVSDVDDSKSGEIEFEEFIQIMTDVLERVAREAEEAGKSSGGAGCAYFGLMSTAYKRKRVMDAIMMGNRDQLKRIMKQAEELKLSVRPLTKAGRKESTENVLATENSSTPSPQKERPKASAQQSSLQNHMQGRKPQAPASKQWPNRPYGKARIRERVTGQAAILKLLLRNRQGRKPEAPASKQAPGLLEGLSPSEVKAIKNVIIRESKQARDGRRPVPHTPPQLSMRTVHREGPHPSSPLRTHQEGHHPSSPLRTKQGEGHHPSSAQHVPRGEGHHPSSPLHVPRGEGHHPSSPLHVQRGGSSQHSQHSQRNHSPWSKRGSSLSLATSPSMPNSGTGSPGLKAHYPPRASASQVFYPRPSGSIPPLEAPDSVGSIGNSNLDLKFTRPTIQLPSAIRASNVRKGPRPPAPIDHSCSLEYDDYELIHPFGWEAGLNPRVASPTQAPSPTQTPLPGPGTPKAHSRLNSRAAEGRAESKESLPAHPLASAFTLGVEGGSPRRLPLHLGVGLGKEPFTGSAAAGGGGLSPARDRALNARSRALAYADRLRNETTELFITNRGGIYDSCATTPRSPCPTSTPASPVLRGPPPGHSPPDHGQPPSPNVTKGKLPAMSPSLGVYGQFGKGTAEDKAERVEKTEKEVILPFQPPMTSSLSQIKSMKKGTRSYSEGSAFDPPLITGLKLESAKGTVIDHGTDVRPSDGDRSIGMMYVTSTGADTSLALMYVYIAEVDRFLANEVRTSDG